MTIAQWCSRVTAAAAITLGTVTALAGGAVAGAQTGVQTYVADMSAPGEPMTMAITVEGDRVLAYATNGVDEEAYFIGTRNDDRMDLVSTYGDTMTASVGDDGTITGGLSMNTPGSTPMTFTASSVTAPAGLYTAADDAARAMWIVRPNLSVIGVMDNSAPGDHRVTDAVKAREQAYRDSVRQQRRNQSLQPAPAMDVRTGSTTMHGSTAKAVPVTPDMSL